MEKNHTCMHTAPQAEMLLLWTVQVKKIQMQKSQIWSPVWWDPEASTNQNDFRYQHGGQKLWPGVLHLGWGPCRLGTKHEKRLPLPSCQIKKAKTMVLSFLNSRFWLYRVQKIPSLRVTTPRGLNSSQKKGSHVPF